MTVTVEPKVEWKDLSPCRKQIAVEVSWETVAEEYERVWAEFKRAAKVPGFRPGNAPQDLLERHHGEKAKEEVIQRLVRRTLDEALGGRPGLDLVGHPQVSDVRMEPKGPLSYTAHLEIAPQVTLGSYQGLKLTRPKAEPTPEQVEKVLVHLQERNAQLKPLLAPRAAAAGDFLVADVTEKRPNAQPKKQKEVVIHLDLEKDPEKILQGLVGMNPGESRALSLKEGVELQVELTAIKAKETPPIDDAFARLTGPFETLDQLKEAVRADLKRQTEAVQRQALETQVLAQLDQTWSFEVPPSMVGSQARRNLQERAVELMNQGTSEAQLKERVPVLTDQAKLAALKEVRVFFILRRVAQAEGITATQEEVEGRVKGLAEGLKRPAEELRKELESRDLLGEIAWGIVRRKALDLIIRQAQIQEAT